MPSHSRRHPLSWKYSSCQSLPGERASRSGWSVSTQGLLQVLLIKRIFGILGGMKSKTPGYYQRHRFPTEIIRHAKWLYHRFCLRFREVEELLVKRCFISSYETLRQWCQKFCPAYVCKLKKRQDRSGDTWQLACILSFSDNSTICGEPWTKTVIELIGFCKSDACEYRRSIIAYGEPGLSGLEGMGVCIMGERKPVPMCSHQVQ